MRQLEAASDWTRKTLELSRGSIARAMRETSHRDGCSGMHAQLAKADLATANPPWQGLRNETNAIGVQI